MRRSLWGALLLPWLLLFCHSDSLAQSHLTGTKVDPGRVDVGLHGIIGADSAIYVVGPTSLPINDTARDRDLSLSSAFYTGTLFAGQYDSTAAIDTRGWNYSSVYFYPTFYDTTDPVGTIRGSPYGVLLGVSLEGGLVSSTDLTSTFKWLPNVTGANADTMGATGMNAMYTMPAGTTPVDTATAGVKGLLCAGEIGVYLPAPGRCSGVSSTSTSNYSISGHQRVFKGMVRGWKIDLMDKATGQWWRSPYTSAHIRVVAFYDSLGAKFYSGPNARVTFTATIAGSR